MKNALQLVSIQGVTGYLLSDPAHLADSIRVIAKKNGRKKLSDFARSILSLILLPPLPVVGLPSLTSQAVERPCVSTTPCPESQSNHKVPETGTAQFFTEVTSSPEVNSTPTLLVSGPPPVSDAPLTWMLGPKDSSSKTDRILARLALAESRELNPALRADIRQAWIIVFLAAKDDPQPLITSSYEMFGTHPDNVFTRIQAERRAKLGQEFSDWYDSAGNLKPELPKKSSQSSPISTERTETA